MPKRTASVVSGLRARPFDRTVPESEKDNFREKADHGKCYEQKEQSEAVYRLLIASEVTTDAETVIEPFEE